MRTVTTHYHDYQHKDGRTVALELPFPMSPIMAYRDVLVQTGDDRIVIGYLADDSDCDNPLENDEYMGHIYEARRNGPTLADFNQAMGIDEYGARFKAPDPFAVMLDYYEHGQCQYSVAGEGMQCRFDTVKGNVVFVPSDQQREELVALPVDEAQGKVREYAAQACDTYTDWRNGNCFGVVVATYDTEGTPTSEDACWGFIGEDSAYASLKSDYFPKETK